MKKFEIIVGGVSMFIGDFSGAMMVVESSIEKPRFDSAKSAIESAEVGSKFRVTSRIKGSGSKATIQVIEVAEAETSAPAPKAKKGSTPEGIRAASWKFIVEQIGSEEVEEVSVRKAAEKRYELKVNGKMVWYSFTEEVANAAKAAVETKLMKAA